MRRRDAARIAVALHTPERRTRVDRFVILDKDAPVGVEAEPAEPERFAKSAGLGRGMHHATALARAF
jgi:hypothetical protein